MKKLLLLIAILGSFATLQAASVKWNSSSKIADSSGVALTSKDAFTSLLNGGSLVLVLLQDESYSGTIKVLGGDVAFKTTPPLQKGLLNGTYAFTWSDESSPLKDGDVLGVMFQDADGNLSQLVYTADNSLVNDTLTISGLKDNTFSTNFNYGASGNFTVVPEPTSGLLFLLGIAGLALRRKQA